IFSELKEFTEAGTIEKMLLNVHEAIVANLPEHASKIHVSAHIFADDSDDQDKDIPANPTFYPDLQHRDDSKKFELHLKRVMDVVGSILALILFSPLFIAIAAIIKLTSEGPIFFTQERLGQFGSIFTCLKFRTMYANNDPKIHQEFMKKVIKGQHDGKATDGSKPVYKMTDDPRITRIGRFIRKTSLDELPQFINVLCGEMSLVGPRPPLAYEFEEYDIWHRRRVLEVKPGITGLWQVKGRSRVCFEDMVRLDLKYARGWSLWMDLQIILETPGAVLFGNDAY
ncbi:MAG TPA: sugar transferase, partial [Candidatus Acidoferrum sp.]